MSHFKERATIAAAVKLGCLSPEDAAALRTQVEVFKSLTSGWRAYGYKDGEYVDDIQMFFDDATGGVDGDLRADNQ